MPLLLGAIADDYTGATDLANTLVKSGLATVQTIGPPDPGQPLDGLDAVVVALKSRTIPADEAVAQSLAALSRLQADGVRQVFFKYCSTFDSTDAGNIGPIADALMAALDTRFSLACPAFPGAGRTVYQGHLFVQDRLLSESSMRDHPLTPMTDADLVRVLGRQSTARVGLVPHGEVAAGAAAIRAAFGRLPADASNDGGGRRTIAIVDAISDADLMAIGQAAGDLKLITGGSGVAQGLADTYRADLAVRLTGAAGALPAVRGPEAVLSGSCSAATNQQVARAEAAGMATLRLDPLALADGRQSADTVLDWARPRLGAGPVLVAATAPPEAVQAVQDRLGRDAAGALVESTFADLARALVAAGVRRLVVAGGETSGAVVNALAVRALTIGPEIAPGVPATVSRGGDPVLALTLKSGNFGGPDFFADALAAMP